MKLKKYLTEVKTGVPKGGRQHTSDDLKAFAKRKRKEGEHYLNVHNDPNSSFNRHVRALMKHVPEWTKIEGIGVYRVPNSRVAALPTNDKKSSQDWIVFDVKTRKEITQLKKKELFKWLSRYAVDTEGMK